MKDQPPVKPYVAGQTGTLADVVEQGPDLKHHQPAGPNSFGGDAPAKAPIDIQMGGPILHTSSDVAAEEPPRPPATKGPDPVLVGFGLWLFAALAWTLWRLTKRKL